MNYTDLLNYVPAELATVLISMLPIVELRGAIPVAIGSYHLSVMQSFLWAVAGNMVPAFFVLYFFEKFYQFITLHVNGAKRFFDWLFERTRKKFNHHYDKHGALALLLFVAIPLPMTGVWTASIAAFLLGLKARVAVPYLLGGVIIAGIIVTLISVGIF